MLGCPLGTVDSGACSSPGGRPSWALGCGAASLAPPTACQTLQSEDQGRPRCGLASPGSTAAELRAFALGALLGGWGGIRRSGSLRFDCGPMAESWAPRLCPGPRWAQAGRARPPSLSPKARPPQSAATNPPIWSCRAPALTWARRLRVSPGATVTVHCRGTPALRVSSFST